MSIFLEEPNKQDLQNSKNYSVNFQAAYQHFPTPYQSLDVNGDILEVNLAWLEVLGYARQDVIGKNFSEFLQASEEEVFKANFANFKREGTARDITYSLKGREDAWILVEFNGTAEYGDKGGFKLTHCMFQDVTSKKIAEEKLIKSEKKYKELFRSAPIGLYEIDYLNKKFIEVNDAMCNFLGYSREELLNKNPQHIMAEGDQEKSLKFLALINSGKKVPQTVAFEVKTKTGAILQVRLYLNFLKKHGKIVGARVVAQGVDESKDKQK